MALNPSDSSNFGPAGVEGLIKVKYKVPYLQVAKGICLTRDRQRLQNSAPLQCRLAPGRTDGRTDRNAITNTACSITGPL